MLDDSLSKKQSPEASWGVSAALLLGFCAYFAPQLLAIFMAPTIVTAALSDNLQNAALVCIVELLTIGCVGLLVYSYGHTIRVLGLGKFRVSYFLFALLAFCIYFVATVAMQAMLNALLTIPDQPQDLGFSESTAFENIFIGIGLVILAPFAEELLFRGFIFSGLCRRWPFWLTTLVVSILFALAHGQLNVGLDVFVLSLVLCVLRERTNSLWPCILLHACKNMIAFVLLFVLGVDS